MRKNTREVLEAWIAKEAKGNRGESIWTDGKIIYSYNTWILAHNPQRSGYEVNGTKYSATTSSHQNSIKEWLQLKRYVFFDRDNQPIGSNHSTKEAL